jgi:hypothetical protein
MKTCNSNRIFAHNIWSTLLINSNFNSWSNSKLKKKVKRVYAIGIKLPNPHQRQEVLHAVFTEKHKYKFVHFMEVAIVELSLALEERYLW